MQKIAGTPTHPAVFYKGRIRTCLTCEKRGGDAVPDRLFYLQLPAAFKLAVIVGPSRFIFATAGPLTKERAVCCIHAREKSNPPARRFLHGGQTGQI